MQNEDALMRESRATRHYIAMSNKHLDDHDLERYYLGQIENEAELAPLEEHYLGCPCCAARAEQIEEDVEALRVDLLRVAALTGDPIDMSRCIRRRPQAWRGIPSGLPVQ